MKPIKYNKEMEVDCHNSNVLYNNSVERSLQNAAKIGGEHILGKTYSKCCNRKRACKL